MRASSYRLASRRRAGGERLLGALVLLAVAPILSATTAAATPPPGTPVLHQSAEVVAPRTAAFERQGWDVALSADASTLAVANPLFNPRSTVAVYVRSGGRWVTQATLRPPPSTEEADPSWGEAIAISADGDTLAVAAPATTVRSGGTGFYDAGVVHLFTRSGRTWRAAGQLVEPTPRYVGRFGLDVSVSADGARVAVGSTWEAYVADTGSRVVRKLPAPAGAAYFGRSVAMSSDGRTIVLGAPGFGGSVRIRGGAYVLVDDPVSGWQQRWHLEAPPGRLAVDFGEAVAVSDTGTVVVGEPSHYGEVSVFDRRGADLVRTASFTPAYHRSGYALGASVAVSADGSTVVAGGPLRRNKGAGFRWVRSPGGWSWAGLLSKAQADEYDGQGSSTAMSGDGSVVVLGAPGRHSPGRGYTGAAIVFTAVS